MLTPVKPHLHPQLTNGQIGTGKVGTLLASNVHDQDNLPLQCLKIVCLALRVEWLQTVEGGSGCHCAVGVVIETMYE